MKKREKGEGGREKRISFDRARSTSVYDDGVYVENVEV